jgi:hypothetical protein
MNYGGWNTSVKASDGDAAFSRFYIGVHGARVDEFESNKFGTIWTKG